MFFLPAVYDSHSCSMQSDTTRRASGASTSQARQASHPPSPLDHTLSRTAARTEAGRRSTKAGHRCDSSAPLALRAKTSSVSIELLKHSSDASRFHALITKSFAAAAPAPATPAQLSIMCAGTSESMRPAAMYTQQAAA